MATKATVVEMLATNDKTVGWALLVLHANQTADEQASEVTNHNNGRGFRPSHARMGSSMAKFFKARHYLTPKQVGYWRKPNAKGDMRIAIYWRQLLSAAEERKAKLAAQTAQEVSFNYGQNATS